MNMPVKFFWLHSGFRRSVGTFYLCDTYETIDSKFDCLLCLLVVHFSVGTYSEVLIIDRIYQYYCYFPCCVFPISKID